MWILKLLNHNGEVCFVVKVGSESRQKSDHSMCCWFLWLLSDHILFDLNSFIASSLWWLFSEYFGFVVANEIILHVLYAAVPKHIIQFCKYMPSVLSWKDDFVSWLPLFRHTHTWSQGIITCCLSYIYRKLAKIIWSILTISYTYYDFVDSFNINKWKWTHKCRYLFLIFQDFILWSLGYSGTEP
jgi:hypothetical protein